MRWLLTDHQASWVFRWIWNQGGRKGKLDLCVSQEEFLGGQHNMHLDVEPAKTARAQKKRKGKLIIASFDLSLTELIFVAKKAE